MAREPEPRFNQHGVLLCHAHRSQKSGGGLCNAPAVKGAKVCQKHGGGAPQVKRKASLRLLELVNPAIATLAREMAQADKSADRQRAANSILDRAGVPRVVREVEEQSSREVLLARLIEIRNGEQES